MTLQKKNYYSTRQAAELLGVAVSTIQLWTNNSLLRAWTTVGGHRRIARESVDEMLSQQQSDAMGDKYSKPLSIVVVEDNAQQVRLYQQQFQSWAQDAHVVTAIDGYEGLIKIGHNLPDIIITDLMMPKMDGFEMIRALKQIPELEHCLLIVVSGLSEDEIVKKGGLPEGVQLFIKPVPFDKLRVLIRHKTRLMLKTA